MNETAINCAAEAGHYKRYHYLQAQPLESTVGLPYTTFLESFTSLPSTPSHGEWLTHETPAVLLPSGLRLRHEPYHLRVDLDLASSTAS